MGGRNLPPSRRLNRNRTTTIRPLDRSNNRIIVIIIIKHTRVRRVRKVRKRSIRSPCAILSSTSLDHKSIEIWLKVQYRYRWGKPFLSFFFSRVVYALYQSYTFSVTTNLRLPPCICDCDDTILLPKSRGDFRIFGEYVASIILLVLCSATTSLTFYAPRKILLLLLYDQRSLKYYIVVVFDKTLTEKLSCTRFRLVVVLCEK